MTFFAWGMADISTVGTDHEWAHVLVFRHPGPARLLILNLYGFATKEEAQASVRRSWAQRPRDTEIIVSRVRSLRVETLLATHEGYMEEGVIT